MADSALLTELGKMRRPIPGSSLTNNPNEPLPFEGPPTFTKRKDAVEEIFSNLIDPEIYPGILKALMEEVSVMNLTQLILFEGFTQGKWNPDLFIMLIEPTAYMIMALAERADIEYIIDFEEDDDGQTSQIEEKFNQLSKKVKSRRSVDSAVTPAMQKAIDELPIEDSLLSKKVNPTPTATQLPADAAPDSLLVPPEDMI